MKIDIDKETVTAEQWAEISRRPFPRGYLVYMCGERDDQPNVPNEANPYPAGSPEAQAWDDGSHAAYVAVLDTVE